MATGKDGFGALTIGRRVTFSKTITESDVYLFAGITGDLSPNHVDEEYMRKTRYGRRIAHGEAASPGAGDAYLCLPPTALAVRPGWHLLLLRGAADYTVPFIVQ